MNDEWELCATNDKSEFDVNKSVNLPVFGFALKLSDSDNVQIRIRTPVQLYIKLVRACVACTESQKMKDREERARLAHERRELAERKRREELSESLARHQEIRRKQEEERRRRMEELKRRDEEHRILVEERRKRLLDEENVWRIAFSGHQL